MCRIRQSVLFPPHNFYMFKLLVNSTWTEMSMSFQAIGEVPVQDLIEISDWSDKSVNELSGNQKNRWPLFDTYSSMHLRISKVLTQIINEQPVQRLILTRQLGGVADVRLSLILNCSRTLENISYEQNHFCCSLITIMTDRALSIIYFNRRFFKIEVLSTKFKQFSSQSPSILSKCFINRWFSFPDRLKSQLY